VFVSGIIVAHTPRKGYSNNFEDLPDTRVDLAIAYLDANQLDDSLVQANHAIATDPENARAWNVQGKVWLRKQDPNKGAESLQRSIDLHPDVEAAYFLGIALLSGSTAINTICLWPRAFLYPS
jgi:Tfp pilus assembly protein PilF